MTLPVAGVACLVVWVLVGLVAHQLWPHLACFAATVYVLVEMSNQNALLRVRSRMVSSSLLMFTCASGFLLPQFDGAVVQLCSVVAVLFLFQTYQDKLAMGRAFYAFAAVGVASLACVHVLWYVPLLWLLMATQLQSLSWRMWMASLLGLATPYWFAVVWLLLPLGVEMDGWQADLTPFTLHFAELTDLRLPSYLAVTLPQVLVFILTLVLATVGIVHFWNNSFEDKIRIRLLYGFFTTMTLVTLLAVVAQPQHYGVLMRVAFITASPLVAHVFTFTSSRLSNILFFVALASMVALTVFNLLWTQ